MLRSAQVCKNYFGHLRTITKDGNKEIRQMTSFFHLLFELCLWYSIFYLKIVKIHFHGVLLSSILVCKIPEFWRCKLWDQKFASFDSGNIHTKESKKTRFYFFYRVENQIYLISCSAFACSRMLFCIWLIEARILKF